LPDNAEILFSSARAGAIIGALQKERPRAEEVGAKPAA
jgi:hypothetical protein